MAGALTAYGLAGPLVTAAGLEGEVYSMPLAVVVLTLALTYVNLVISELYPKRIALCHGEKIALSSAGLILGLGKIVAPFNWILSASVHLLLILTRQKRETTEESFSEDDVKSMLEVGQETGVLNEQGKRMINSIFAFDDKKFLFYQFPIRFCPVKLETHIRINGIIFSDNRRRSCPCDGRCRHKFHIHIRRGHRKHGRHFFHACSPCRQSIIIVYAQGQLHGNRLCG